MSTARLVSGGSTIDVQAAEVTMPRVGAWHAIGVADDPVPAGPIVLEVAGVAFTGTALALPSQALPTGRHGFRLVGGAGGLGVALPPRYYRSAPASLALRDVVAEAGEELDDDAALDVQLSAWARPEGTAGDALRDLVRRAPGAVWRVTDAGQVWTGVDAWEDSGVAEADVLEVDTVAGVYVLATTAPTLRPGTLVRGERCSAVVHRIGRTLRTEAWIARAEEAAAATDRTRWALDALIRRAVPTAHLRAYRCRVLGQNADGTLELRPEAQSMPAMSSVPIRPGLPGVEVEVTAGAHVHVLFADGDAARPFAALWDVEPGLVRLTFAGGANAIARVGDTVDAGQVTAVAAGNPVTFTYTAPGQPPVVSPTLIMNACKITSGASWGRG